MVHIFDNVMAFEDYASSSKAGPPSSKVLANCQSLSRGSTPRIQRGPKQERTPEALVRLNVSLRRAVKRDDLGAVIRICRQLSLEGCQPNIETYEYLLSVLAAKGLLEESWAIMADMEHSGLAPTVTTYNYLLEASSISQ